MSTLARPPARAQDQVPIADRHRHRGSLVVALVVVAVVSLVLHFWSSSPLWLDEAQSVAIARLPLHGAATTMWTGLRQDGSPPLYYLLLHFWTLAFGDGARAVRALSGAMSVASFPLLWLLGRRVAGTRVVTASVLLFATSPFAVRFATETRMYSLLVLLAILGGLALHRALTDGPRPLSIIALAVVSGGLALTHYWSFYLLGTLAAGLAVAAWRAPSRRRVCLWALFGVAAGAVLFVPWLPNFFYQLAHTGTPWGRPQNLSAVVSTFGQWAGGASPAGRFLLVVIAALLVLAVFAAPVDERRVVLDLAGREPGRLLLALTLGTLVLAVFAGQVTGNAWADRYTAAAFVPFLLVAGLGIRPLAYRLGVGFMAVACVLGLIASRPEVVTPRTQAGDVAKIVNRMARPGDIVVTCPDQLGPALARLVRPDVAVLGAPTLQGAARVDWVDYATRQEHAAPYTVVNQALQRVGSQGTVFLALAGGYRTYESLCGNLASGLQQARPSGGNLTTDNATIYEHEGLDIFPPSDASAGGAVPRPG
ncbi:MAG: glycosyltransferase family 39 protein [Actinomycetota bacterium]|nr:glycosyltransferase family 39 protein [Actinomycetota bacterium]